jgi:methylglutaconyl-CoA hydratase
LNVLEINDLETSKKFFGGFAKVLNAMRTCGKIVVVRVQGKTTGGGVGIACAADYCFATKDASLALPELNLGIGPFVIGPFVERKIGKSQFTAMSLDTEFRIQIGQKKIKFTIRFLKIFQRWIPKFRNS